jgi:hypothetical protein
VNADGSVDVKAKDGVKVAVDEKTGATVYTFKNGDTVAVKNGRITDTTSNNGQMRTHFNSILEDAVEAIRPLDEPHPWTDLFPRPAK